MTDLLKLAEQAEQAEGPSRELDAETAKAAGWKFVGRESYGQWRGINPAIGKRRNVPRYTASLDAAMTLVPKGWRIYSADFSIKGRFSWTLMADRPVYEEDDSAPFQGGVATAPALALTAACLRAKESGRG